MIASIKNTDIYLIDQILKERFQKDAIILDAGCGNGRNLTWFYKNNYPIFGIDVAADKIAVVKENYPNQKENFTTASLEKLSFKNNKFDVVICNAVLHFAKNEQQFQQMFAELFRVLNPNGIFFIRMTSNIGIENKVQLITNGVYQIPDGSTRFLLTTQILKNLKKKHPFSFIEPLKTVNVNNLRCMTTLVLHKL